MHGRAGGPRGERAVRCCPRPARQRPPVPAGNSPSVVQRDSGVGLGGRPVTRQALPMPPATAPDPYAPGYRYRRVCPRLRRRRVCSPATRADEYAPATGADAACLWLRQLTRTRPTPTQLAVMRPTGTRPRRTWLTGTRPSLTRPSGMRPTPDPDVQIAPYPVRRSVRALLVARLAPPRATGRSVTDPHPTRPDLPVLPASADSGLGNGPVAGPAALRGPAAGDRCRAGGASGIQTSKQWSRTRRASRPPTARSGGTRPGRA